MFNRPHDAGFFVEVTMEYINWAMDNWEAVIIGLTSVIGGCAMLAKLSPSPRDDRIIGKIAKIINVIGMNFGNTKNVK